MLMAIRSKSPAAILLPPGFIGSPNVAAVIKVSSAAPAAVCTLSAAGNVVTVTVEALRTVCYEFDTQVTNADLALPYAVEINGHVESAYASKPRALSKGERKINLHIAPGSKVALYLNSDAHPDFRRQPVYALTVGEHDVLVKIKERIGRIGHETATLGAPLCHSGPGGSLCDVYEAALTGDIWMQISHLYTVEEADKRLPHDIAQPIRQAVLSIYQGLARPELRIENRLRLRFIESDNIRHTTTDCPLLSGVLPRTHPCAYAALIMEALATGVTEVQVSSCWRPMLGSIVHRAGLGLDVDYLEDPKQRVHINRASLTSPTSSPSENVSSEERRLYQAYEKIKSQPIPTTREGQAARKEAEAAALKDWNNARDLNEPASVRNLRSRLQANSLIHQTLDPWYMNYDTANHTTNKPNEQITSVEKIHKNHLHITVREPKIL